MDHARDAKQGRAPASGDDETKDTEGDDETEDAARRRSVPDPDSPGATIDNPTPAEPNEPG